MERRTYDILIIIDWCLLGWFSWGRSFTVGKNMSYEEVYEMGKTAGYNGLPYGSNPFDRDFEPDENYYWRMGWMAEKQGNETCDFS